MARLKSEKERPVPRTDHEIDIARNAFVDGGGTWEEARQRWPKPPTPRILSFSDNEYMFKEGALWSRVSGQFHWVLTHFSADIIKQLYELSLNPQEER